MTTATTRAVLESFFSPRFLFNSENIYFRNLISPPQDSDEDASSSLPPLNPIRILLQFREARHALTQHAAALTNSSSSSSSLSTTTAETDSELFAIAAEVLKDSEVVEVVVGASSTETTGGTSSWSVRRKAWLREDEDPILRTVVLRPLHADSTHDEIKQFLAAHGVTVASDGQGSSSAEGGSMVVHIESITVQQRVFSNLFMSSSSSAAAAQAEADSHYRSTAFIVLRSAAEANILCQKKYSFSTLIQDNGTSSSRGNLTHLAKYFLPKVSIIPAQTFQEQQEDAARQRSNEQLKKNIIRAQASLQNGGADPHLAAPHQQPAVKFAKGSTILVTGVSATATWATLKSNLGESQKNGIRKVYLPPVVADGESRTGYVFCHSAAVAQQVISAFYSTEAQRKNTCEALSLVEEGQEASIVKEFGQSEAVGGARKRPRAA